VLYVLAMVAVVVGVDVLFFRHRFWERLLQEENLPDIQPRAMSLGFCLMLTNRAGVRHGSFELPAIICRNLSSRIPQRTIELMRISDYQVRPKQQHGE